MALTEEQVRQKIKETVHEILPETSKEQQEVINVIKDYFGEDLVDVQSYFPENIIITNFLNTCICDVIKGDSLRSMESQFPTLNVYDYIQNIRDENILNKILENTHSLIKTSNNLKKSIYIRFPKVRVTNEYDSYIDITELYVDIPLNLNGTTNYNLTMARSEYTLAEWIAHYSHSHLPSLSDDDVPSFHNPCFGNGPIYDTIGRLSMQYDIDRWGLLCMELEKYVATESLKGGPYIKLERVSLSSASYTQQMFYRMLHILGMPSVSQDDYDKSTSVFLKYFLTHYKLPIAYRNGQYVLGCSNFDFTMAISNSFIEWYNSLVCSDTILDSFDAALERGLLVKVKTDGIRFYSAALCESLDNVSDLNGQPIQDNGVDFYFKGKPVLLNIKNADVSTGTTEICILSREAISYFASIILYIINYKCNL